MKPMYITEVLNDIANVNNLKERNYTQDDSHTICYYSLWSVSPPPFCGATDQTKDIRAVRIDVDVFVTT